MFQYRALMEPARNAVVVDDVDETEGLALYRELQAQARERVRLGILVGEY